MAEINEYVVSLSYRNVGDAAKQHLDNPAWDDVKKKLRLIDEGEIEFLSLFGPEDDYTHMAIIGKPGNYHIGIFIDEDEEYLFKASENNDSKIDIAGEYWPEYQVSKNWEDLVSVVGTFFESGKPSDSYEWIYFSEED
ncbi:MAG: hypothetical protein P8X74_22930 [Reinekea sp.]